MLKTSPYKLVLCATAKNLLAGVWHASAFKGSQAFESNEAGYAAFAEFLSQYANAPVYLITDAVEEDYRLENIPHTSGSAKRELIERKLNQFYRSLSYRTAHFIGREQDKRRDDKYLFAALNNAEFMQGWIAVLQSVEAQLVGVYLLPMISQVMVRQLKLMAPHILLCEKLSSGLRQTYLHNGRLRMSRLMPNVPDAAGQLGYFYLVETEKTRLYLISQRLIARETPLNLVLVSTDGSTNLISQAISQEQNLESTDINLSQFVKHLKLPIHLVQQTPELLHMQLLANGNLVDNLAPAVLTQRYQFGKLKQAIKLTTLFIGLLGVALALWEFAQGLVVQSDLEQAQIETMIQQKKYDEEASNFPETVISAADLQLAVELDKKIASYPKSPRRMMQVVSAALENRPEIELNRLHWSLTNDANVKDEDKLIILPGAASQQAANASAITIDSASLSELGFITAEIAGFSGDYRAALNSVNLLVANLRADKRVAAVEVLQQPVNVSSFANLQGNTTDELTARKEPAMFKLKLLLNAPETLVFQGGQ